MALLPAKIMIVTSDMSMNTTGVTETGREGALSVVEAEGDVSFFNSSNSSNKIGCKVNKC